MANAKTENHGKGRTAFGFGAGIFVGLFALTVYAGCAGDCMTCHPKLKGSKDHIALTTCIKCHTPASKKLFEFGSSNKEGCGDNCFDCHKEWPKDGNHAPMLKCENCHKKYKK